jgi:hypothetical protein
MKYRRLLLTALARVSSPFASIRETSTYIIPGKDAGSFFPLAKNSILSTSLESEGENSV